MKLFLVMIIITAIEVVLITKVGSLIGFWGTLSIIIITAMIGSWQLKKQGIAAMTKMKTLQTEPSQALIEGIILLVCGAFLITPGFLTDFVGFIGLIPKVRERLTIIIKQYSKQVFKENAKFGTLDSSMDNQDFNQSYSSDNVIEGEFTVKDDN